MDLRKARQKRDWTLEKVAELIGTTPMSVSRHETGQSFPRPDLIEKYLAIYHGDVTEEEVRATYRKAQRTEKHTSEIQSIMRNSYAVFCLKKKIKTILTTLTEKHKKK